MGMGVGIRTKLQIRNKVISAIAREEIRAKIEEY